MPLLTAERARELLDYDPETGFFTWRAARGGKYKGSRAGGKGHHGYVVISIEGKVYYAHRIAWLITNGSWPPDDIDHVNGVNNDNRITNLRAVSHYVNQQNQRRPTAKNTSGFLGVSWDSSRESFAARIKSQGKLLYLGRYTNPDEAYQAYLTAKRDLHAGCTI